MIELLPRKKVIEAVMDIGTGCFVLGAISPSASPTTIALFLRDMQQQAGIIAGTGVNVVSTPKANYQSLLDSHRIPAFVPPVVQEKESSPVVQSQAKVATQTTTAPAPVTGTKIKRKNSKRRLSLQIVNDPKPTPMSTELLRKYLEYSSNNYFGDIKSIATNSTLTWCYHITVDGKKVRKFMKYESAISSKQAKVIINAVLSSNKIEDTELAAYLVQYANQLIELFDKQCIFNCTTGEVQKLLSATISWEDFYDNGKLHTVAILPGPADKIKVRARAPGNDVYLTMTREEAPDKLLTIAKRIAPVITSTKLDKEEIETALYLALSTAVENFKPV